MSRNTIKLIQKLLLLNGFNCGIVDGEIGPKTRLAIADFKRSCGKSSNSFIDSTALKLLIKNSLHKQDTALKPVWLYVAESYLGEREIKGTEHNSKILDWFKLIGASIFNDEIAWCAAFVGGVLEECSIDSAGKLKPVSWLSRAAARQYTKWGRPLAGPAIGAIAVFSRGKVGFKGHVGFIVGKDLNGNLMVLGGNQADEVNIRAFKTDRLLSYRWPLSGPIAMVGFEYLPLLNSTKISTNEA